MNVLRIVPFFAVMLLLAGCSKSGSTNNCNYDACSFVAPANEVATLESYLSTQGITGAVKHCSGMYYKITNPGTGATASVCSGVQVRYRGAFTSGSAFTENLTPNGEVFDLSRLITGWKNGIPLIKAGGSITLYLPPQLAYGSEDIRDGNGNIVIPKNSYLIFDIDLIAVQ